MTRIAVIGGGKIGEALVSGLLQGGHATRDLVVAEQYEPRAEELAAAYSIRVTTPEDAAEGADVIVVAVKPTDVDAVLEEVKLAILEEEHRRLYQAGCQRRNGANLVWSLSSPLCAACLASTYPQASPWKP